MMDSRVTGVVLKTGVFRDSPSWRKLKLNLNLQIEGRGWDAINNQVWQIENTDHN